MAGKKIKKRLSLSERASKPLSIKEPFYTAEEVAEEIVRIQKEKSIAIEAMCATFLWYEFTVRRCKKNGLANVMKWVIEQMNMIDEGYVDFVDYLLTMHTETGIDIGGFPYLKEKVEERMKENA